MSIIYSLIVLVLGILFLARTATIVNLLGRSAWAEQKLGAGGTMMAIKMIGLLLMVTSFFILRYPSMFGL